MFHVRILRKGIAPPVGLTFIVILGLSLFGCPPGQSNEPEETSTPSSPFKTEHAWDAKVTIAKPIILGESKHGFRRVFPSVSSDPSSTSPW
jgi:hypothetical protein